MEALFRRTSIAWCRDDGNVRIFAVHRKAAHEVGGSRLLAGCGVRRARPSSADQVVCFGGLSRSLLLMAVRSRQRGGPCDAQLEGAKVARFKDRDGDVLVVDEVSSSPRAIRTASFSSGDSRAARGADPLGVPA
jgi:hypothetical protein